MKVHQKFKLNGKFYSIEELKEFARDLVKEGKKYENPIGAFLLDWLADSASITVFTSGSTGIPKQINILKEHMVNSALATGEFFGLKPSKKALLCLPSEYIAGKMMLVRAMTLGLELDYVEPSLNPIQEYDNEYDFVAMIPLQTKNSLQYLDSIKQLIIGGAPVEKSLEEQLQSYKTRVFETYGMTETITHIAVKKLSHKSSNDQGYFETLSNVAITQDDRGCLIIDAPRISNERIVTNDIVELVAENKFKWLGRYDSIINSAGVKLIPEQIENKLSEVIENRFFVAGIPDENLGQKLVLVVEGSINLKNLKSRINSLKALDKFEIPKTILSTFQFVESANGKVLRSKTLNTVLKK